jgi:uncharacterized protein
MTRKASGFIAASSPRVPQLHLFETDHGAHLFVANGSRIYGVKASLLAGLGEALANRNASLADEALVQLGLDDSPRIGDDPPPSPPVRSLSLAVAQKCNLGCAYCYAQQGDFGEAPKNMPLETALAAVDFLFSEATSGDRVSLAFLGGEPLFNRPVLRAAAEHAAQLAARMGVQIGFSITTNGTLLTPGDGEFFDRHGFAVTISLDGLGAIHDRLRPSKTGEGSYERVMARVKPLLATQYRMQMTARVTVTPRNLQLRDTLDEFVRLGFHSVGFSPMLSSPSGVDELTASDLERMLEEMITCGTEFERQTIAGRRYPFLNVANALAQLHRGTHRPYPCGAGAGYFGVSAEGELSACHRFVKDERGSMGHLKTGIDRVRQADWLAERHVHRQEPCRGCWARYLCGGGCHHEVIRRGRPACDYIRGWLHYCLQAYIRLLEKRPDYFNDSVNRRAC